MPETKLVYYLEGEETPYLNKINMAPDNVTLRDFKACVKKFNHKFFFQSEDQYFGVVKEEITSEDCILPHCDDKIIAWLVAPDPDSISQKSLSNSHLNQLHDGRSSNKATSSVGAHSSHHAGHLPPNHLLRNQYDSMSTITSGDSDSLSYDSRDDTSLYSTYSELTVSTRPRRRDKRRLYKKKRPKRDSDTISSYSGSVTDSCSSLHILEVTLNMDKYNFLGISLIGQSNDKGDGGIYIGSIMKGGAVAADGRVQPGDMLLEVNDVSFENMTNEQAVQELRALVHKPGLIKLTVAKCWDPYTEANHFSIPKNEPVQPIDPAAWANNIPTSQDRVHALASCFNVHDTGSDYNLRNSLPEAERYAFPLSVQSDMSDVVYSLKLPDSGLEVKTRNWLKITIPDAFIGSDLVSWLQQKVEGLSERRVARKYASNLLKFGYIRHTVNKQTFSEQCYYIFGDYTASHLPKGFSNLSLGDSSSGKDSDPIHSHLVGSISLPNPYHATPYLRVSPKQPESGDSRNPTTDYSTIPFNENGPHSHDFDNRSVGSSNRHQLPPRNHSNAALTQHQMTSFGGTASGGSGSDRGSGRSKQSSGTKSLKSATPRPNQVTV